MNVYWGYGDGVRKKQKAGTKQSDLVTGYASVDDLTIDDENVFFLDGNDPGRVSWTTKASVGSVTNLMWNQNRPHTVVQEGDWVYFTKAGAGDVHRIGKDGYGTTLLA